MTEGSLRPLVSPFIAERYRDIERSSELLAPPYDVISAEQRKDYCARHEHNIVRLILPEGKGDRYARAATILRTWRDDGVLVRESSPAAFVVRQDFTAPDGTAYSRTGLIAAVAVEPYSDRRVRPHEKTHRGPKEDRLALMRSTHAMFEALLLMVRDESGTLKDQLQQLTAGEPNVKADLDNVAISLWRVSGDAAEAIAQVAGTEDTLYMADGHHRYETANSYKGENPAADRTLGLIVPLGDPGLVVLPTHRLIHGGPLDEATVRDKGGDSFEVTVLESVDDVNAELSAPVGTRCVVCLPGLRFLGLRLRPDAGLSHLPFATEPTVLELDVAKIDSLLVDLLRTAAGGEAVTYEPASKIVNQTVDMGAASAGVLVNPVAVEQVLAVADAGAFMPQKSTFFAPKVPSGLAMLGW